MNKLAVLWVAIALGVGVDSRAGEAPDYTGAELVARLVDYLGSVQQK